MKNASDLQDKCLEATPACVKFLKEIVEHGEVIRRTNEELKIMIEACQTIMAYANGKDLRASRAYDYGKDLTANNEGD